MVGVSTAGRADCRLETAVRIPDEQRLLRGFSIVQQSLLKVIGSVDALIQGALFLDSARLSLPFPAFDGATSDNIPMTALRR